MKMKKQHICLVHGGSTFKRKKEYLQYLKNKPISLIQQKSWFGEYLPTQLEKCLFVRPQMPHKENAKYEEWKIVFEKYFKMLGTDAIYVGYSLGGIFLAKYFSEIKLSKKVRSIYLVAAPFDGSHSTEDLVGGFNLKSDISQLETNTKKLTLFFSADDQVVHQSHAQKYKKKLPSTKIIVYKSKNGHFRVPAFPEIVKMIREDLK